MTKLSSSSVPKHIAIVCDGNRRWAKSHKLEVFRGHQHAVHKVFEPLIDQAALRGVEYLTFWIFSTENWNRDPQEVEYLLKLFREFFDDQLPRLHEKNIRVTVIGDISRFPEDIQTRIANGKKLTADNTRITVTLAMSYGGRDELTRAIRQIATKVSDQKMTPEEITPEVISAHLDTRREGIPDPDFIIRTSGEQRLSGFLLWQCDYAEFYFPKFHFPEFTPKRLDEAIEEFQQRQRRFGK